MTNFVATKYQWFTLGIGVAVNIYVKYVQRTIINNISNVEVQIIFSFKCRSKQRKEHVQWGELQTDSVKSRTTSTVYGTPTEKLEFCNRELNLVELVTLNTLLM